MLVAMPVGRWNSGNEVEPGRPRRVREAPFVPPEVAAQDHGQFLAERTRELVWQSLVAEQGVVKRLMRDAVRDRGHRVEHLLAAGARVATLVSVG